MTNNARMIILVSSKGGKYIEPVMWFRTKKTSVEWDDSTDLSLTRWDALKFQAKRNVYFCGVGMTKNSDNNEFVLELKYRIIESGEKDIEPTTIEVDSTTSPVNEERMHWFDIQHYSQNALFCPEGNYIEIGIRLKSGSPEFHYIYSGYDYNYNSVEGQEYDFDTRSSNWN